LLPSVDSIRGFTHAAGFAAARFAYGFSWRCSEVGGPNAYVA